MKEVQRYHCIGTLWPDNALPEGHNLGRGTLVMHADYAALRARVEKLEWLVEVIDAVTSYGWWLTPIHGFARDTDEAAMEKWNNAVAELHAIRRAALAGCEEVGREQLMNSNLCNNI